LRPEQALLFGGDENEQDRSLGAGATAFRARAISITMATPLALSAAPL
jgi:hypothetical protein